jgi:hypothetical protein
MTTTTQRKPYQDYRTAYALKDGRVFVAKCSPVFYGHITPGWILDEEGRDGAEVTVSNDGIDRELGRYGLVAYWKGQAVGLSAHARRPRTPRERKARVTVTTAPGVYVSLTRSEFNRQVRFAWERVPDRSYRCNCGAARVAQGAPICEACKSWMTEE